MANKYLPNSSDIPSTFNLGADKAKTMADNIKKNRKSDNIVEYSPPVKEIPLESDFDLARGNISDLLDISAEAIKEYFKFAVASDSPRAMEVLANMIKDTVDMNKNLIDIHQQRERIQSTKINNGNTSGDTGHTQNNITSQTNIMCSPSDLVKMLQQEQATLQKSAAAELAITIDVADVEVDETKETK